MPGRRSLFWPRSAYEVCSSSPLPSQQPGGPADGGRPSRWGARREFGLSRVHLYVGEDLVDHLRMHITGEAMDRTPPTEDLEISMPRAVTRCHNQIEARLQSLIRLPR